MQSVRAFSGANDANEMLKGLRYFERAVPAKPGMEAKGYFCRRIEIISNFVILKRNRYIN